METNYISITDKLLISFDPDTVDSFILICIIVCYFEFVYCHRKKALLRISAIYGKALLNKCTIHKQHSAKQTYKTRLYLGEP